MKLQTQKSFDPKDILNDAALFMLSDLKPAGTQLLLSPNKTDQIDLLKLTLFDLALKQVVVIKRKSKRMHPNDPYEREFIVIESGKNYTKYVPSRYECYILDHIDNESYFYFKQLLQEIIDAFPSEYVLKKHIVKDLALPEFFSINFFFRLTNLMRINRSGQSLRADLKGFLDSFDASLADLIEHDPKEAVEVLTLLQGNIFFLKNLKFELIEKLKVTKINTVSSSRFDDWIWADFLLDSELLYSDLLFEVNDIFEELDTSFDFDTLGDWDIDVDFDFH
ncbi:MAG: hypothetical protein ABJM06_11305 [Gilvibacter sp.]